MTTHSVKAAALKPGDMLLHAMQYLAVVCVQPVSREPKRVQVTLRSKQDKEIVWFVDRTHVVEVRR